MPRHRRASASGAPRSRRGHKRLEASTLDTPREKPPSPTTSLPRRSHLDPPRERLIRRPRSGDGHKSLISLFDHSQVFLFPSLTLFGVCYPFLAPSSPSTQPPSLAGVAPARLLRCPSTAVTLILTPPPQHSPEVAVAILRASHRLRTSNATGAPRVRIAGAPSTPPRRRSLGPSTTPTTLQDPCRTSPAVRRTSTTRRQPSSTPRLHARERRRTKELQYQRGDLFSTLVTPSQEA